MTPHDPRNVQKAQRSPDRDLRMRYIPRARIRPIYLQAAPWLDLLFILVFLLMAQARLVLRPGVVVALPLGDAVGVQGGAAAVLLPEIRNGSSTATLFFADKAFRMDVQERVEDLAAALASVRGAHQIATLTLYADLSVPQKYVMQIMDMAAKAGFDHLNIGTAPPSVPTY